MQSQPIGVFDSGLGGLTMVKELLKLLPGEDIVYLGDTGRVPYGSRSRDTITKYAKQDAAFLLEYDVKAMVVACNTVCSVALDALKNTYEIPLYEVITAPAKAAVTSTKNGKIGIIGTAATIRSKAYENALSELDNHLTLSATPCPLFVPLVEEGWIDTDNEAAIHIAKRYLSPLREKGIDTLILGCTHYPLLRNVIAKVMGEGVTLIDSGVETAKVLKKDLQERNLFSDKTTGGKVEYFVTDTIDGFSKLASQFLESDVSGMVKQVSLWNKSVSLKTKRF